MNTPTDRCFDLFRDIDLHMVGDTATLMLDEFDYDSQSGWFGTIADYLFLENYTRLLENRTSAQMPGSCDSRKDFDTVVLNSPAAKAACALKLEKYDQRGSN